MTDDIRNKFLQVGDDVLNGRKVSYSSSAPSATSVEGNKVKPNSELSSSKFRSKSNSITDEVIQRNAGVSSFARRAITVSFVLFVIYLLFEYFFYQQKDIP